MPTAVSVHFDWQSVGPVTMSAEGRLVWPPMPSGSGVYRFTLRLGHRARYYVGETDEYRRRFGHYANPGPSQSTNVRMQARLLALLGEHAGTAELHVASDVVLALDGQPVELGQVPAVFWRRLLENAALSEIAASGGEIVNGRGFPPGELWPA